MDGTYILTFIVQCGLLVYASCGLWEMLIRRVPCRLVSIARGEQQYFDPEGIPTATEGCKSNALMRCCKDLGIASELWDPVFLRKFMAQHAREVWVEHVSTKKKRKITVKKGVEGAVAYPYKEVKGP